METFAFINAVLKEKNIWVSILTFANSQKAWKLSVVIHGQNEGK